jgi:SPP1 gp7 family putative phage head morphogenesis protein
MNKAKAIIHLCGAIACNAQSVGASGLPMQDPTGQGANRKRSTIRLQNRLTLAQRRVQKLVRDIPRTRRQQAIIKNDSQVIYDYHITQDQQVDLALEIEQIINDELETIGDRMPNGWFWQEDIEQPYRQGTAEEVVSFNQLVAGAIAAGAIALTFRTRPIDVGEALSSPSYVSGLNKEYATNYQDIKGLSQTTAKQVNKVISLGIQSGKKPSEISADVKKRFDVSRSSAKRTAFTAVNKAYNNGIMHQTDRAAELTGLRAGVIHISALLPTTRAHHADRHGNAYTTAQQTLWWDSGVNRINCHCSIKSVLIDSRGRVIDRLEQEEIRAEKSFFDE